MSTTSTATPTSTGHVPINGLEMYYETFGEPREAAPALVLVHGGISAIGTSFGRLLAPLSAGRHLVAVELQGHGRTADIDRPLRYESLADDLDGVIAHLGIGPADVFGYSVGAGAALQLAIRHPASVRKLVLASDSYNSGGLHPGLASGMEMLQPEMLVGTPFAEEYAAIAPRPGDWPRLIERIKELDARIQDWLPDSIRAVAAPALLLIGDSDIIRPEHAVEMFRLFGGGVAGDMVGLPASRLAVLPGTTHIGVLENPGLVVPIVESFLSFEPAPAPDGVPDSPTNPAG